MSDDQYADDPGIRPVGDDPSQEPLFDDDTQDAVSAALRQWGTSLDQPPLDQVPSDIWDRIAAAVETEQTGGEPASRKLRALPGRKWTTPLVAASVGVLAVAIGASVLGSFGDDAGDDPAIVASQQVESVVLADDAAPPAGSSASPRILQAGFIPPAKKVMALPEDLSAATIATTVDQILEDAGVDEPADVLEMPEEQWEPTSDGMTSDPQVLRDCVTKVTKVETSQALLALRAKVNGVDAGLIVVPEFMVDMTQMDGMDAEKMRRMGRQMGITTVYVVEPTCGMLGAEHDPTLLRVSFTLAP